MDAAKNDAASDLEQLKKTADKAKISDIPASSFMNKKVVTLLNTTKIASALLTLSNHGLSGAPVVCERNKLCGIVTEYDLLLQVATKDVSDRISYRKDARSINENTTLKDIIVLFYKTKFRILPVIDSAHHVVGVVTRINVLNRLVHKGR